MRATLSNKLKLCKSGVWTGATSIVVRVFTSARAKHPNNALSNNSNKKSLKLQLQTGAEKVSSATGETIEQSCSTSELAPAGRWSERRASGDSATPCDCFMSHRYMNISTTRCLCRHVQYELLSYVEMK